ncbi:MAG: bifunctional oligoribonuclease/PAP phosphatase NrnA [Anaerolineae bacterium]|nr:bifunctional oligoribonuclease/PAP phosphatase NrnA [Anaerolineae bacterium]
MEDDIRATLAQLEAARTLIVICHYDPDGDAIGTMLGLTWALRGMGKRVTPACRDGAPWPLDFLPGSAEVVTDLAGLEADTVVVVDCSDARRGGKLYKQAVELGVPIINIDHHVTNTRFGAVNLVRPDRVAAAEVVFELLGRMGFDFDLNTATCLLTGLVTDTRSFKTPNVDQRVLRAAITLMDIGVSLPEVVQMAMERKQFHDLAILGRALGDVRFEDGVAWSALSLEAWRATDGGAMSAAPRNFSTLLNSVEEAAVGVFFTEMANRRIDISMRSKPPVNLTVLFAEGAPLHGQGGGHPQASGAEIDGPLEAAISRLVPALKALVSAQT